MFKTLLYIVPINDKKIFWEDIVQIDIISFSGPLSDNKMFFWLSIVSMF